MSRLPAASHDTSRRVGRKAPGRQGLPESLGSRSFLLSLPSPPRWCSGPELCLGPGRELLEGVRRGAKEKKKSRTKVQSGGKGLPGRSLAVRSWCYSFRMTYGNLSAEPQLKEVVLRPLFPTNFCVKC